MKLIIGVLIGAYIIFNWGDIREYMDSKVSSIPNSTQDEVQTSDNGDMHTDVKITNDDEYKEKKDDGWGDFR
jgi:hypothetical protein